MSSQGRDTNTVLTNLSNYLAVVSNEPYCERKLQRYGLPSLRCTPSTPRPGRRGLRPLHRTTLNLASAGEQRKLTSTMKDSFSGKRDMNPVKQFKKCPSLHTSQFNFGENSQHNMTTTNGDCFKNHPRNAVTTHVDRTRWNNQMEGGDMINCTRHAGSNNIDFATTYSQNYHQLTQNNYKHDHFNGRWRTSIYNICNGNLQVDNEKRFFGSVSGNQVLSKTRKKSQTSILC